MISNKIISPVKMEDASSEIKRQAARLIDRELAVVRPLFIRTLANYLTHAESGELIDPRIVMEAVLVGLNSGGETPDSIGDTVPREVIYTRYLETLADRHENTYNRQVDEATDAGLAGGQAVWYPSLARALLQARRIPDSRWPEHEAELGPVAVRMIQTYPDFIPPFRGSESWTARIQHLVEVESLRRHEIRAGLGVVLSPSLVRYVTETL